MIRTHMAAALVTALLFASATTTLADVKADTKSLVRFEGTLGRIVGIFGGKAAREGITSTVAVRGDRKATITDSTGQVIDLGEEKVYDLDIRRKTYKVTTFDEMRRQMEEARRRAEEDARREQPEERQPEADRDAKEVEVDFTVRETGEKKRINGFDTRQVIMTITLREKGRKLEEGGGMVMTSDAWLTASIAAMNEIAAFDLRYAQQLQGPLMSGASAQEMAAALAMYPMLTEALARQRAEAVKLDGTPILTTLTVEAVKSAEEFAEERARSEESGASGGVSGLLGGLARRAARREEPTPRATFMTTTSEVLKVATSVADADVAVPAGFKETK